MALDKPSESALAGANDSFVTSADTPAFPLVRMKVIQGETDEAAPIELRVNQRVHDMLAPLAPGGDMLLYVVPGHSVGWWQQDMIAALRAIASLGIFPDTDDWIRESHASLARAAERHDVRVVHDAGSLAASEGVLDAVGLLEHVKGAEVLYDVAAVALQEKSMDLYTLIYRLAMSVYHSADVAGRPVRDALDSPGAAYAAMLNGGLGAKLESMGGLAWHQKALVTKLVVSFAIASYVYGTAAGGR